VVCPRASVVLLVVFTVLAHERIVTRAAARLWLSQPAVSRALQRLRDMFHDDLLFRSSSGYESKVNDLFEVTLRETPAGVRLRWEMKKDREAWRDLREGAYMLRTNLGVVSRSRASFRFGLCFIRRSRESKPTFWWPFSVMPCG
jgi:hypothetical protein